MGFLLAHLYAIGLALVGVVVVFIALGMIQNWRSQRAQRLPDDTRGRGRRRTKEVFPPHDRKRPDVLDFDAAVRPVPDSGVAVDSRAPFVRSPVSARPDHLSAPRASSSAELRAELAKLGEQVGTLEERMESGIGGLRRRIEQLEARVDGRAESSATIAREVESPYPQGSRYDSPGGYGGLGDGVVSQPLSLGLSGGGGELGGGRVAVELNGTEVSLSSTIPPDAWLTPRGDGKADVSLDPDVHYHKFALDRFATFFDLGDRREGSYVTRSPAQVRWDDRGGRGVLVSPGKAVAR